MKMYMIDRSSYNNEIYTVELVRETEKSITVLEMRNSDTPRQSRYMDKPLFFKTWNEAKAAKMALYEAKIAQHKASIVHFEDKTKELFMKEAPKEE